MALLQIQEFEGAVNSTLNVLRASKEVGVKRVILTSTMGAVYLDPNRNPQSIFDEKCWSDLDYCLETKVNYFVWFEISWIDL